MSQQNKPMSLIRYKILKLSARFCSSSVAETNTGNKDVLLCTKYRSTTLIGLNRPDKRNALDTNLVNKLETAINDFENDKDMSVAILFGEGGNFCSGYDLKELEEKKDEVPSHFIHNTLTERYLKKPIIAAISGYAVGAGFDLALWCDLRVMDETSVVGCLSRRYEYILSPCKTADIKLKLHPPSVTVAEIKHLTKSMDKIILAIRPSYKILKSFNNNSSLPPLMLNILISIGMTMSESGIARLQSIVGVSKAMELLLLGGTIKTDEAARLNICNKIAPCGTAVGLAIALANELCKYPQAALLSDRATLYKHAYSKIPLKNSVIDNDSLVYRSQVTEDIKFGAKLFSKGVGKHGNLFSTFHWSRGE